MTFELPMERVAAAGLQDHGEHWCGSLIVYDPDRDIHMCTGPHDDPELQPEDCPTCEETTQDV